MHTTRTLPKETPAVLPAAGLHTTEGSSVAQRLGQRRQCCSTLWCTTCRSLGSANKVSVRRGAPCVVQGDGAFQAARTGTATDCPLDPAHDYPLLHALSLRDPEAFFSPVLLTTLRIPFFVPPHR